MDYSCGKHRRYLHDIHQARSVRFEVSKPAVCLLTANQM